MSTKHHARKTSRSKLSICNLQFAICNSSSRRVGTVMIVALVCLALMAVMVGVVLRWALMERKLLVRREQKSQAFWLAEAGIERAAAQLDRDQEYSGETWTINADDLPSGEAARVRLKIAQIEGQPRKRSIEVEAEYPAESKLPAKIHKQVVYQLRSGEHP